MPRSQNQHHLDKPSVPASQTRRGHATSAPSVQRVIQRAQAMPHTLSGADVKVLQRSVGNRETTRLLQPVLQAKLQLGPAGDQYEQEADRVADQVVRASRLSTPPVQRESADEEALQMQPLATPLAARVTPLQRTTFQRSAVQRAVNHGLEGGEVDASVAQQIGRARGGGQALDDGVRRQMEQGFGADFSGVRVHTGGQADTLNRSLNAKAFTAGNDIFFGKGQYNPGSSGGQKLIAHELTHTVQQGAAGVQRDVIQRDIGFEFETQQMYTRKTNQGPLPNTGFPDQPAGSNAYNGPTATRVPKGAALLAKADIEVQADDANMTGTSDVEVVTTHFPLDANGRTRLDQAMTDLDTLIAAYIPLGNQAGQYVPARALNGAGGFAASMDDGMFLGSFAAAQTAGQVTMGIRARDIGDIVRDLHGDRSETGGEKTLRDPGRLRMRSSGATATEPTALAVGTESNTLVDGHTLAQQTLRQYMNLVPAAPGGPALEGLLTVIFTYCESMQRKRSFLKNHTPFMAKTNLATIFTTLPDDVQTYYSRKYKGKTNFERLVEIAPNYAAKMSRPLFDLALDKKATIAEGDGTTGKQWFEKLTLKSWLRGIVLRDRGLFEAIQQKPKKLPGKDKLTNKAFPGKPKNQEIEGYGALGDRMDTDVNTPESLPVFELRSANKMITYAQAHQWALDFFDYVQSLNDSPEGGQTLMT